MRNRERLRGLYVITDAVLTPSQTILKQVSQALKGGATIVQLRDKKSSLTDITKIALELEHLCKKHDAIFILNDEVALAIELGLSGLHVGKSDHHRVAQIRKDFSGYLGVSCYDDVNFAKEMQDLGVDYVAFGSFFHSPTKPTSNIVPLETITKAKEQLSIPVCVIGGLNSQNIDTIMQYKPDMISLISAIWESNNIEKKSNEFSKLYEIKI